MSLILATAQTVGSHFFRTASWPKPSALWVGLFTTMPNTLGAGGVEVAGGGYARVQRDPGDLNWGMDDWTFFNMSDIIFPIPAADWGMIVGVGLWSAQTNGTLYMTGVLTSPVPEGNRFGSFVGVYVRAGETEAKFDAGQLRFPVS